MNLSYGGRLLFECLSAVVVLYVALSVVVACVSHRVGRKASTMAPRRAVAFVLSVRLAPVAGAILAIALLGLPSYLWLEPAADGEKVAWSGIVLASFGAALLLWAAMRGATVLYRSARWVRERARRGRRSEIAGISAVVIESAQPVLALAGVFRPKLVISNRVLQALPAEQLAAAVRHERAHWSSRDNLKRLAIAMSPAPIFASRFLELEHAWARFIEWSADDCAAHGNSSARLSLASALVSVSRLGSCPRIAPLATGLMNAGEDLSARVDRLLSVPASQAGAKRRPWAVFVAASIGIALAGPTLRIVHGLLEELIH